MFEGELVLEITTRNNAVQDGTDDIRLRPYFTLNFGLRNEISSVPAEFHGNLSTLRVLAGNAPHTGNPYIQNPTFKNFEPRVGFAWDPFHDGKTSVRSRGTVVDPNVGQNLEARWNGNSCFHGLETQLKEAANHGIEWQLPYTSSRCIDTSSAPRHRINNPIH